MILPGRVCSVCGDADVFAVRPGRDPEFADAPLAFVRERGETARCWCERCWRLQFAEKTA